MYEGKYSTKAVSPSDVDASKRSWGRPAAESPGYPSLSNSTIVAPTPHLRSGVSPISTLRTSKRQAARTSFSSNVGSVMYVAGAVSAPSSLQIGGGGGDCNMSSGCKCCISMLHLHIWLHVIHHVLPLFTHHLILGVRRMRHHRHVSRVANLRGVALMRGIRVGCIRR